MTNLLRVLARVEVQCNDDALPLYKMLSGTTEVQRFALGDVSLAWVGSLLLLRGPPGVLTAARRVATLFVRDIDEAVALGHGDGAVFEYIQPTRRRGSTGQCAPRLRRCGRPPPDGSSAVRLDSELQHVQQCSVQDRTEGFNVCFGTPPT